MKANKRLCVDLRWIDCSGIGTYIKGLMPGLTAAFQDSRIVGLGSKKRLEEFDWGRAPHVELIDCNIPRYSLTEQWVLPLAIPRGTDIYFSPHYPIPLLYGGRLVVTVHDLSHLVVPEIANNLFKRAYAKTMLGAVRRRASLILTVSDFSKSELLRCTRGARIDNILTIHEGVSDEWFDPPESQLPYARPYIVYVGNVKPYKNVSRLVEAFIGIKDAVPHDLLIVGQREGLITGESNGFFERAKSAGDRIRFTGHIAQLELLALVKKADALVLPSLYEGFGFPPLEAMAAGVPTVVARAGSLPEICGEASVYCDPLQVPDIAASIQAVVCDGELRKRLISAGRDQVKKYSWKTCAERTAEAIRNLL